jgi:uncharacterized membrane protein YhaH (DUF805 family)
MAVGVFMLIVGWKIFTKAGQPGWGVIVPFVNVYLMLKIAGRPGWWLLLFFIPFANIIVSLILAIDLAKSFGQSAAFGLGLFFLGPIFGAILAFGDARYVGPAAADASMAAPQTA